MVVRINDKKKNYGKVTKLLVKPNLNKIVKYFRTSKEKSYKKNLDVKVPNLKKVNGTDSYQITSLGRHYLTMIDR